MLNSIKHLINNKVFKNASWIIFCKIVQAVLNLVVTMLSARYLGPSGYGLINYAASVVAFVTPIMQLGVKFYFGAGNRKYSRKRGGDFRYISSNVFLYEFSNNWWCCSICCYSKSWGKGNNYRMRLVQYFINFSKLRIGSILVSGKIKIEVSCNCYARRLCYCIGI